MSDPLHRPAINEEPEESVEDILRQADENGPLPPYPELVIEDLSKEEGEAFRKAILS